jgi:hypothetical protein
MELGTRESSASDADATSATDTTEERASVLPSWLVPRTWILVLGATAGLLAVSGTLDSRAQASADRVFHQALLTYAAVRTLDAAVSLAEGTEIALQPGGMGVTVSAGEVLEPIDDIVEQFSSVMLVSTTSLGVQSLLLRASAWGVITVLLIVFLVARVGTACFPDRFHPKVRRFVAGGTSLLLVCRFAVPVYALGSAVFFERFLQPSQVEAVQAIEETSGDIREIEQLGAAEVEEGWVGRVSAWFSGTVERLDVPQRMAAFRDRVSTTIEHLMHLLVVFTLQTILLPLVFVWALPKVVKVMIARAT